MQWGITSAYVMYSALRRKAGSKKRRVKGRGRNITG
jgi:hypothetical protein